MVEAKSNNATGTQVPGISLYPKLLSFVERGEEIVSGPNAEETLGKTAVGWRPPASASPIPTGGAGGLPAAPAVSVPVPTPTVSVPVPTPAAGPTVSPALAAQGITWPMLQAQGWTEEAARQQGHLV